MLDEIDLYMIPKSDAKTMDCVEMFELALAAMKHVTETVNEGKKSGVHRSKIG